MLSLLTNCILAFCFSVAGSVSAQSASTSGYVGYNLTLEGDQDSVIYATDDTRADASEPDPDVYLNASLYVGEIDIEVDNLTAKINLDLQVLQLLQFNAGVDLSIDRVRLLIENVTAKVILEARLENVVKMVNDTLSSIDLNPIIASLGQDVSSVINNTVGGLTESTSSDSGSVSKRSYDLEHNVLFSVNDYSGNTHTNTILAQNGDIVQQSLDNDGNTHGQKVVGSYKADMSSNGHEKSTTRNGQSVQEVQYVYAPFHGLNIVAAIFLGGDGNVVATQVLSEFEAGGSSTIGDL